MLIGSPFIPGNSLVTFFAENKANLLNYDNQRKASAMIPTEKRQTLRTALIWELVWTPFELVSVGIGLWMLLVLQWITLGNLWVVALLAISFVVRYRHYAIVAPKIHGLQTNPG